ncbi:glutamate 5-kinase [Lentibacillus cibarius]|uniref:Glutamate 5-kinase n=1 Tax=Lentibacillus cibarius TaxID=2583219 RepID=A0A549YFI6_9BACI|nr:glutamate 5-kinase [Lentibacillus cibarius]TRM10607.1 glutamate 5-kinase [Lentibacillus cibarius]
MAKKRIVVKIGSSLLTNKNGGLSETKLLEHADALANLKKQGHEVILISSGAVAAGYSKLGYPSRPVTLAGKQATAAVGQGLLIEAYTESLKAHGITAAQLLLTRDVFGNEAQYSNVYNTLTELLKRSVLPIINENDSVAVDELTFGDNDMLSALVSGLVHADFLIMLTDIDGVYKRNPKVDPTAKRYDVLPAITVELFRYTKSKPGSKVGTGGMTSKLLAARTALSLGVPAFVGTGSGEDKLKHIVNGTGEGTYIGDNTLHNLKKPKQWIAFHSPVSGKIEVDEGAEAAIVANGKSLLPAGTKAFEGVFDSGDVVEIINSKKRVIGRGQVNYSSADLSKIRGLASEAAMQQTNRNRPEVIHRDRLILTLKEENVL